MAIGDSAGLLFKIKADDSDAIRAFKNVDSEINKLTGATGGLTSSMAALVNPATLAAAAITAVTGAAVAGARAMYDLAKSASDYGSEIHDASIQTGLSVEAVQALKFAAEQGGSSFEKINSQINKFNVLVGEANQGSEKAQKTLEKYGITATDTTEALEQAVKAISEMTSADEKAVAAKELFKDKSGEVLKVIDSMNGDLPAVINKLRDLGIIMGKDDTDAADAFGDQMDLLNKQLEGVYNRIGVDLIPVLLELAQEFSNFLSENKTEIASWSSLVAKALRIVIAELKLAALAVEHSIDLWATFGQALSALAAADYARLLQLNNDLMKRIEERIQRGIQIANVTPAQVATRNVQAGGGSPRTRETDPEEEAKKAEDKRKREAERRAQERQEIAKRDAAAQVEILRGQLDQQMDAYEEYFDRLVERVKSGEDPGKLAVESQQKVNDAYKETQETLNQLFAAEDALAKKRGETNLEGQLRIDKQIKLAEDLTKRQTKIIDDSTKAINELAKKTNEERKKAAKEEKEAHDDAIKSWKKRIELMQQAQDIQNESIDQEMDANQKRLEHIENLKKANQRPGTMKKREDEPGFLEGLLSGDLALELGNFTGEAEYLGQTLQTLGEIGATAFGALADGVGNLVQNWVLLGTTGPDAMKKLVASVLAGVAAQAAVLAIFELAKGFAALFFNPAEAAAHFKAAALFGVVALGAGLAGRAIAGDSFQRQSGAANSASVGSSGGGGGGSSSSNQGEVYSGQKEIIMGGSWMKSGQREPVQVIEFRVPRGWLADSMKRDIETNGPTRLLIRDVATDS